MEPAERLVDKWLTEKPPTRFHEPFKGMSYQGRLEPKTEPNPPPDSELPSCFYDHDTQGFEEEDERPDGIQAGIVLWWGALMVAMVGAIGFWVKSGFSLRWLTP